MTMQTVLPYWVFNNGEKSSYKGIDWGVKHASPVFVDRSDLDTRYCNLLHEFSMDPDLNRKRPNDGVGLILLPWEDGAILGFIFPGIDHKGRNNTSAVICAVPGSVTQSLSVTETAQRLWEKNDITGIARKGAQDRPDTLNLDGDTVTSAQFTNFEPDIKWPKPSEGYLLIDGSLSTLNRAVREENGEEDIVSSTSRKKFFLGAAVIALVALASFMLIPSREQPSDNPMPEPVASENKEKGNEAPPQTTEKSPQAQPKVKNEVRKDEGTPAAVVEVKTQEQEQAEKKENALKKASNIIWKKLGLSETDRCALIDIDSVPIGKDRAKSKYGVLAEKVINITDAEVKRRFLAGLREQELYYKASGAQARIEITQNARDNIWKEVSNVVEKLSETDLEIQGSETLNNDKYLKRLDDVLSGIGNETRRLRFFFKTARTDKDHLYLAVVCTLSSGKNITSLKRYIVTDDTYYVPFTGADPRDKFEKALKAEIVTIVTSGDAPGSLSDLQDYQDIKY